MKPLIVIALLALTSAMLRAQGPASPNETAQFLAGLPVRGTPLEALSLDHSWSDHASDFDKAWKQLEARQLAKIRPWAPAFLGEGYPAQGPMFYMFSGPDFLYAHQFFPNASTYILCGLEPVGSLPDVTKLKPGTLGSSLGNLRKALNSVLSFSFFITKDMKTDLGATQLSGTLPVLYVFLARAGCKIDSAELVSIDKEGAFASGKDTTNGVKIVFFGPEGKQQTLYYFSTDISNWGIKKNEGFLKFCDAQGSGVAMLKAASYLMHSDNFTTVRDFVLAHSKMLVQDDSGIPIQKLDPTKWNVRLFGSYPGPIDLFKKNTQPALAQLYKTANAPALDFGFGYRWHPSQSSLILITPKPTTTP